MDILISEVNEADLGWKADVCKYQKHHAKYGATVIMKTSYLPKQEMTMKRNRRMNHKCKQKNKKLLWKTRTSVKGTTKILWLHLAKPRSIWRCFKIHRRFQTLIYQTHWTSEILMAMTLLHTSEIKVTAAHVLPFHSPKLWRQEWN